MCWLCDNRGAAKRDALDKIRAKVDKFGWTIEHVRSRDPRSYTIGLREFGEPELLVTGLPPDAAEDILTRVALAILEGMWLHPGSQLTLDHDLLLEVVAVDQPYLHLCIAVAIEGPIEARQLVWSDPHGLLPWDPEYGHGHLIQPVLGRREQPYAA